MQVISARRAPAHNDNLPTALAETLAMSLASLRDIDTPYNSAAARAFARFRSAVLAMHGTSGPRGRQNSVAPLSIGAAAARLAETACLSAHDFILKAVAGHALVYYCAAGNAARNDAAGMVADARAIADFMANLAADAVALSVMLAPHGGEA